MRDFRDQSRAQRGRRHQVEGWEGRRRGGRMRRGDIRTALLAILAEESGHGYDVIQRLEEKTSGAWRPSPGSVYPTLQLLEDEGLARIESLLARDKRLSRVPVQPAELPGLAGAITPAGDLRTLPSMWAERGGLDGFYIARLRLG